MPQMSFERCVGRLILDPAFRVDFFSRPEATLARDGIHLSEQQLHLLEGMPITPLLELAASIAAPPALPRSVPAERRPAGGAAPVSGSPAPSRETLST